MPRPCAVEAHVRSYKDVRRGFTDATALRRGGSRSQLQETSRTSLRCHGLAPWSFTLLLLVVIAWISSKNVSLHGARPWHPQNPSDVFCSCEREAPRRKAVASVSQGSLVFQHGFALMRGRAAVRTVVGFVAVVVRARSRLRVD